MRELAREWIASIGSSIRGHGGGERANASVGAAFVIGAVVVAVLGLRWISASGPTEEAADDTPWDFGGGNSSETTGTTIPASLPARVVVVRDPGNPPPGTPVVTLPDGQTGVFLPGFPPVPGGTTGTTGPGSPGTNPGTGPGPGPTTTRTGPGTGPGATTTAPPDTTTSTAPPDTTTTTAPPDTTTTTVEENPPPEQDALGDLAGGVSALLGGLGRLIV